jgi:hypothetical protein
VTEALNTPENDPNELQLDIWLADYAKVSDNKLDLLGGGWTTWTGSSVGPMAVAIVAKVPSSWEGRTVVVDLELIDEDGRTVTHAPRTQGQLQVKRSPQQRPGEPTDFKLAINMGPVPLVPGRSYSWRVTIDGAMSVDWQASFFVADATPPQGMLRPAS